VSKARLVITAVEIEGITQAEAARRYSVRKGWVSKLIARYRDEGDAAFEPRSKAPRTSPNATPGATIDLILELRRQLTDSSLDAGADTSYPVDVALDLLGALAEPAGVRRQLLDLPVRVEGVAVRGEDGTELGIAHDRGVPDPVDRLDAVPGPDRVRRTPLPAA